MCIICTCCGEQERINDVRLAALALLVAESAPRDEAMIRLVMNALAELQF